MDPNDSDLDETIETLLTLVMSLFEDCSVRNHAAVATELEKIYPGHGFYAKFFASSMKNHLEEHQVDDSVLHRMLIT